MPIIKCEQCGKEFKKSLSQIKRSKTNFCSKKCFANARSRHEECTCSFCGKKYFKKLSQIRRCTNNFCTTKCHDLFIQQENKIIIKEGHAELIIEKLRFNQIIVLIDIEDINKINKLKWHAKFDKTINNFYIAAWERNKTEATRKQIRLHRFLTACPDHLEVDHINHNTLDNRKINLRCVTSVENNHNRRNIKNVR